MKAEFGKAYFLEAPSQALYEFLYQLGDKQKVFYTPFDGQVPKLEQVQYKIVSNNKRGRIKSEERKLTIGTLMDHAISRIYRGTQVVAIEGIQNFFAMFGDSDTLDAIINIGDVAVNNDVMFIVQSLPNKLSQGNRSVLSGYAIHAKELSLKA